MPYPGASNNARTGRIITVRTWDNIPVGNAAGLALPPDSTMTGGTAQFKCMGDCNNLPAP